MATNFQKALRFIKNIRLPFPDLRFLEGQTNCFKKRSEKFFPFFITDENILQLFFSGGNARSTNDDIHSVKISYSSGYQRV
jgi:hypothetical protein